MKKATWALVLVGVAAAGFGLIDPAKSNAADFSIQTSRGGISFSTGRSSRNFNSITNRGWQSRSNWFRQSHHHFDHQPQVIRHGDHFHVTGNQSRYFQHPQSVTVTPNRIQYYQQRQSVIVTPHGDHFHVTSSPPRYYQQPRSVMVTPHGGHFHVNSHEWDD